MPEQDQNLNTSYTRTGTGIHPCCAPPGFVACLLGQLPLPSNRQHAQVRLSVTALEDRTVPTVTGDIHLTNADGSLDFSQGIGNLPVSLYQDGNIVATTRTDADGVFSFDGTWPGTLAVQVDSPAYRPSGATDANSRVAVSDDVAAPFGVVATGNAPVAQGTIQGTVFEDANGNGVQDTGETVAGGVRITLFQESGTIASTVTDAQGHYAFSGLADGSYGITADAPGDIIEDGDDTTTGSAVKVSGGGTTIANVALLGTDPVAPATNTPPGDFPPTRK